MTFLETILMLLIIIGSGYCLIRYIMNQDNTIEHLLQRNRKLAYNLQIAEDETGIPYYSALVNKPYQSEYNSHFYSNFRNISDQIDHYIVSDKHGFNARDSYVG
jgi:hypothetical protein